MKGKEEEKQKKEDREIKKEIAERQEKFNWKRNENMLKKNDRRNMTWKKWRMRILKKKL